MDLKTSSLLLLSLLLTVQCHDKTPHNTISSLLESTASKEGKQEYLDSPFVTAGDKLYMVGHQDGSFPDLGWHVEGEMGGIWDHPIKLMDGFAISVQEEGIDDIICLDNASSFKNYPTGNMHRFSYNDEVSITRTQFVSDATEGIIIELNVHNNSDTIRTMDIEFTGMIDLMPVWLSDSLDIRDGIDRAKWDESRQLYTATDSLNSWHIIFGSNLENSKQIKDSSPCSSNKKGNGTNAAFSDRLILEANSTQSMQYYISGSSESAKDALKTYQMISSGTEKLLANKINRYENLRETSSLTIPDKEIEDMYTWMKYNTDWLIRDVDGVGRGLSAGIPDYPWWFAADNAYALQGLLATGRFDEVLATLDLLYKLSEKVNGNGRVIHEASTNGVVFNKGNMNETPHIIYLIWKIYEWTGDKAILEKYYGKVQSGLEFLLNVRDKDGNLYPNGHGMMEIRGLDTEMIDVAVYTQQALQAAAYMARELGKNDDQSNYQNLAVELREKINSEWWVPEYKSFADFRATKAQALSLIDDAIVRADTLDKPWAVEELQSIKEDISRNFSEGVDGYVVHHNWVVNTPLEMAIADTVKAQQALATARDYTSRFGMYVTGIDRDEEREEASKWEVFSYVGAVMTLPTGVQAIAEANYGNTTESYEYLKMLENSFSYALPGSMYEVSPDYGMIVQAWNIYSVAVPIVEHYFGIHPKAYDKHITVQPQMPKDWENASLEKVRVGSNTISVSKKTTGNSIAYTLEQTENDWSLDLKLPYRESVEIKVNGVLLEPEAKKGLFQISLNGRHNSVVIQSI